MQYIQVVSVGGPRPGVAPRARAGRAGLPRAHWQPWNEEARRVAQFWRADCPPKAIMRLLCLMLPLPCVAAATTVQVAPGGSELRACAASGASRCHLLPGVHREDIAVAAGSSSPIEITGAPGSVLSGAVPVPGPWTLHQGHIYKATLPPALRSVDIQQAWARETWLPEARWPNTNLTHGGPATAHGGPLSLSSWATTYGKKGQTDNCTSCTRLREGVIVDQSLAATGIDFTGALATLNVGFRFFTWTRRVISHSAGSPVFHYNQTTSVGQKGMVGGSGAYLDKGADNLYFLSGVLAALDSPGEYFIDEATQTMYLWMPDSGPPASVEVKVKDFCAQGAVHLSDVAFWGCTFHLQGNGLRVHNVSLQYPSYHKTIDPRDVIPGAKNGCQFHFLSMFSKLLANHRSFTCMKNSWFEMQACLLLSHQDRSLLRRFSRGTMA